MAATNRLLIQVGQQGAKFLRFERHLGHVAAAADLIRLRAHVIRVTGKAVGALASYVEFGVLQQGLCRLERALVVGIVEAFSSFYASNFKEVIVFTLLLPVLILRSLASPEVEEEED